MRRKWLQAGLLFSDEKAAWSTIIYRFQGQISTCRFGILQLAHAGSLSVSSWRTGAVAWKGFFFFFFFLLL